MVNGIDYKNKAGVCEALLGLLAFNACDSVFHGRRKVKAQRAMLKMILRRLLVAWTGMGSIARAI